MDVDLQTWEETSHSSIHIEARTSKKKKLERSIPPEKEKRRDDLQLKKKEGLLQRQ